jgi:hypothetical protein
MRHGAAEIEMKLEDLRIKDQMDELSDPAKLAHYRRLLVDLKAKERDGTLTDDDTDITFLEAVLDLRNYVDSKDAENERLEKDRKELAKAEKKEMQKLVVTFMTTIVGILSVAYVIGWVASA